MQKEMYIFLDKVVFHARHGVDPQETLVGANFSIDLKLKTDFSQAAQTDELKFTVSYADIYEAVKEEMQIPSRLLEHVAGRITERIFRDFPAIEEIELKLTKENPPMGADSAGTGVILHCKK